MTEIEIARENVIAAALILAGNRIHIECSQPGAYDDAQMELDVEILDHALEDWLKARLPQSDEHTIQFNVLGSWIIQHPLHERIGGGLFDCEYNWKREPPGKVGKFVLLKGNILGQEVE